MNVPTITGPSLILDEQKCRKNIQFMAEKAESLGCTLRPHFKTHQSVPVGHWMKDAGIKGITVTSTTMAKYFVDDGWNDITLAFPFYPGQLQDLKQLEQNCKLRLFVNSAKQLELLDKELSNPFRFVIEIDPGYGRSGIPYRQTDFISSLIKKADTLNKPVFHGFYIHEGRTYQAHSEGEIIEIISPAIKILRELKQNFPEASTSLGDTPSACVVKELDGIDEITPGNFVFYDWMQVQIGSCTIDDVALLALFPVAQIFDERNKAIIHGGAVHLSKDYVLTDGKPNYGQALNVEGSIIKPVDGTFLVSLSQEHGTLQGARNIPVVNINGQPFVWICPIHSCLSANLFSQYLSADGKIIEKRILS